MSTALGVTRQPHGGLRKQVAECAGVDPEILLDRMQLKYEAKISVEDLQEHPSLGHPVRAAQGSGGQVLTHRLARWSYHAYNLKAIIWRFGKSAMANLTMIMS